MAITVKSTINPKDTQRISGIFEYVGSRVGFKDEDIVVECLSDFDPKFEGLEFIRSDYDMYTDERYNVYRLKEEWFFI